MKKLYFYPLNPDNDMNIDTSFLEKCIATLEKALGLLRQSDESTIDYDLYCSACGTRYSIS